MPLDSAEQSFNTGPPQFAASSVTVTLERIEKTDSGIDVVVRLQNTPRNSGGFFPKYTVTVAVDGNQKQKESDVFPGNPVEMVFSFDSRAGVEVEANPGRGMESLFLSSQLPDFAEVQEPAATIDVFKQKAVVSYTLSNAGGRSGTADVTISVSGTNVETKEKSVTKTVPPSTDISDSVTFEFSNDSPIDVEICVEKQ